VVLPSERFTVASAVDLTPFAAAGANAAVFASQAEAYQHQSELIRSNPALAGQILVVSQFELAN
jgi:2-oxo-4-hydroxy-4-carboxy--5-ureidoimidazoline (OHCU) decarboxylase